MMITPRKIRIRNNIISIMPFIYSIFVNIYVSMFLLIKYQRHGFSLPLPGLLKRCILKRYAIDYQTYIFVETGTFLGDTVWFFRDYFREIYTFEVSPVLADLAKLRFSKYKHINVIQGDSSDKLIEIVTGLAQTTLFWLDAHYSSGITSMGSTECPIIKELIVIFSNIKVPFVILIDDARSFGYEQGFPSLEDVKGIVSNHFPNCEILIENDIIRITRGNSL